MQKIVFRDTGKDLFRYFMAKPSSPSAAEFLRKFGFGFVTLVAGLVVVLMSWTSCGGPITLIFIIPGIVLSGQAIYAAAFAVYSRQKYLAETRLVPSDEEVDCLFRDRIQNLITESQRTLDLSNNRDDPEPIAIWGPILQPRHGMLPADLVWKLRSDGSVVCGVYSIVVLHLTQQSMGVYACVYNFLRNSILQQRSFELQYSDIITVELVEEKEADDDPLILPDGTRVGAVQRFRLIGNGGHVIELPIDTSHIQFAGNENSDFFANKVRYIQKFVRDYKNQREV